MGADVLPDDDDDERPPVSGVVRGWSWLIYTGSVVQFTKHVTMALSSHLDDVCYLIAAEAAKRAKRVEFAESVQRDLERIPTIKE